MYNKAILTHPDRKTSPGNRKIAGTRINPDSSFPRGTSPKGCSGGKRTPQRNYRQRLPSSDFENINGAYVLPDRPVSVSSFERFQDKAKVRLREKRSFRSPAAARRTPAAHHCPSDSPLSFRKVETRYGCLRFLASLPFPVPEGAASRSQSSFSFPSLLYEILL